MPVVVERTVALLERRSIERAASVRQLRASAGGALVRRLVDAVLAIEDAAVLDAVILFAVPEVNARV